MTRFLTLLALLCAQILLVVWGTKIFQVRGNPIAIVVVSVALTACCFQWLRERSKVEPPLTVQLSPAKPWLYALVAMLSLFTAYEELRKIWLKFPEPGKVSDVLPQLKGQCNLFFTDQFPYQPIKMPTYETFPVYMPLHWSPIQIAESLHIDIRWSGVLLLLVALGVAGYFLGKTHPAAARRYALPGLLLLALPVWGFAWLGEIDLALSLETVVAAWYVMLAAGLASRNHILIAVGIAGALLTRYTLVFWLPLFAVLLWLHAPRKYSYWVWGSVGAAFLLLFVLPFWVKEPAIIHRIAAYYTLCTEGTWLRPDEFTFIDGLGLNIHLREWLPGSPEQNLPYARWPQVGVQLLLAGLGIYFFQKKWRHEMDFYTFSLVALSIMPLLFYSFSPMLFRYYFLVPLCVSAVLCWKVLATLKLDDTRMHMTFLMKRRKYTFPLLLLLGASLPLLWVSLDANEHPRSLIASDTEGYYIYLPATVIYGGFDKVAVRDTNYLRTWPGTDKIYSKYTCGVAMMEAPFFLAAHALSSPLGYTSDGHSEIYCYGVMLAAIFYMLAGMWLLWGVLRKYYGVLPSATALLGLLLGTNLYYYTFFQAGMSHVYSFFLFSALLWLTEQVLEKQEAKHWALLGLTAGLLALARPTNAVVLLYPLYRWWKQTPDKQAFVRQNIALLALSAALALAVWIPQMMYWKSVTGQWVVWSYGEETFKYWKEPKLFRVLFDAWNGWLLYSPIAFIPLLGLFMGRHTNRHSERILMFILAVATYLFASWWAWWFGGAFGHRSYVEYYALLALPFAAVAHRVFQKKWSGGLFALLCVLLIYYNLGLTYHYRAPWDGENWTYESVWNEIKRLF
jgi:hypothetical protein